MTITIAVADFIDFIMILIPLSQIRVVQATGLPQHLSNFVFCQYHFWEQEDPVFIPPEVDPSTPHTPSSKEPQCLVVFDSSKVRATTLQGSVCVVYECVVGIYL